MIEKVMDKKHVSNRRKNRHFWIKYVSRIIFYENNNTVIKYMYIHFGLSLKVF